jgi:uncharacterized cofD-like protein
MMPTVVALGGGTAVSGGHRILAMLDPADADAVTATREPVSVLTEFADGTCIQGDARPAGGRQRIRRLSLTPGRVRATPEAVAAIARADRVVLGPASLYAALLPTLLVRGIASAIAACRAPVVLVMNLMSEPTETDGYNGTDVVLALRKHVKQLPVALTVLVNSAPIPELVVARYARAGQHPIRVDDATLSNLGCRVVRADLLADGAKAHHDPVKLERALAALGPVARR